MTEEELKQSVIQKYSDKVWNDIRYCGWSYDDKCVLDKPCHAGFNGPGEAKHFLSSTFVVLPGYEEVGEKYWQFMSGQDSPWRDLWDDKPPEKFCSTKHGRQMGFFIRPDVNAPLCKNYFIAMRMVGEYPDTIRQWAHYVDLGLSGGEALLLSRIYRGSRLTNPTKTGGENDGCHWPLNIVNFSYKRFLYQNPRFEPFFDRDSLVWGINGAKSFRHVDLKPSVVESQRFSRSDVYDSKFVVEEFKKFIIEQLEKEAA